MLGTLVAISMALAAPADRSAPAPEPPKTPPANEQGTSRDFDSPPPGSAEDQALWRAAYEANNGVPLARGTAARLQQRATASQYYQRLEALQKDSGGDLAGRAAQLQGRLRAEWTRSFEIAARQWPVDPTRACRYPMLNFESAMFLDEGPEKRAHLAGARKDLRDCLERAQLAIGAMGRSNKDFEAVLGEVERFLAAAPSAAAGGGAPPAGAPR